jgi:hypothetical protein
VNTPPPGFDPTTASDDQLAALGFPKRPAEGTADFAHWTAIVSAKWVQPEFYTFKDPTTHKSMQNRPSPENWAGYQNTDGGSSYFSQAQAEWPSSNVYLDSGQYSADEATWVGLGIGASGSELVQAGTEGYVSSLSGANYSFWWETYDTSNQDPSYGVCMGGECSPRVSDTIYVNVGQSGSTASFFFEDLYFGTYTSFNETIPSGWSSGQTAEWINETPEQSGGSILPLPGFSNFDFTYQETQYKGSWNNFTNITYGSYTSQGSSYQTYAYPGSASGDTSTMYRTSNS